jgi:hypothetical protein
MKSRSHQREVTYERGRVKEGSEEGDVVHVLSTRVNREFLKLLKSP